MPETTQPALVDVTERAAHKGQDLLKARGILSGAIRLKVVPGGCSGFSYDVQPVAGQPIEGDLSVQAHGLTVFIDKKSLLFLAGTRLDYQESLMSKGFVFTNPNAAGSCGCGKSFGV